MQNHNVCSVLGLLGFTKGPGILGSGDPSTDNEDITSGGSSMMLLAEASQSLSDWDASVPMQNWEVRQEKLLNWLRLHCEMSSPGECISGSGAASPFCLSHCRPAWEQHWDSCISGVRDGQHGP